MSRYTRVPRKTQKDLAQLIEARGTTWVAGKLAVANSTARSYAGLIKSKKAVVKNPDRLGTIQLLLATTALDEAGATARADDPPLHQRPLEFSNGNGSPLLERLREAVQPRVTDGQTKAQADLERVANSMEAVQAMMEAVLLALKVDVISLVRGE